MVNFPWGMLYLVFVANISLVVYLKILLWAVGQCDQYYFVWISLADMGVGVRGWGAVAH